MKLAVVADPLDSFKIAKDTTFAIMREASARGHELYALEPAGLYWHAATVHGEARRIHLTGEKPAWYRAEPTAAWPLARFDAVLMRKDPPFDMEYVYSTYLLELAETQGARIVNRAHGGQVLISESTRAMAGRMEGLDFIDLGRRRLRGIRSRVRLFEVVWWKTDGRPG